MKKIINTILILFASVSSVGFAASAPKHNKKVNAVTIKTEIIIRFFFLKIYIAPFYVDNFVENTPLIHNSTFFYKKMFITLIYIYCKIIANIRFENKKCLRL